MFLAVKEMRRAKVRFGLLIAAVALLGFLILFQQTLQNGLVTSFSGGVRNQSAPVLVFNVDGRRNLQNSTISAELERLVAAVPGVGRVGRIGKRVFGTVLAGKLRPTAVVGYQTVGLGSPTTLTKGRLPSAAGEGVASESDASKGYGIGAKVAIQPGELVITIVGQATDINVGVVPTVFTTYDTYVEAVHSINPDARTPLPSVMAVEPAAGVTNAQVVNRINAASVDLEALTRADAADAAPGVSQVRSSFRVVFILYGLVVPFVIALFFLIVTFQKAESLTLLRAIGAPASRLVASLLVQVVIVVGAGLGIGTLLYTPVSFQRVGGIPLKFETLAVVAWAVGLLAAGVVSALFAARRVIRIDPMAATTGRGLGS